jgi:hypothetical protein
MHSDVHVSRTRFHASSLKSHAYLFHKYYKVIVALPKYASLYPRHVLETFAYTAM